MKNIKNRFNEVLQTRLGFTLSLVLLYWVKTLVTYATNFKLDTEGFYQNFIAFINPLPLALLLIGLALYIKNTKAFYRVSITIYFLLFIWLFSNAIYYREFSDYISISTIMASKSVAGGLGESAFKLFTPWDILYFSDFFYFFYLKFKKKFVMDQRPFNKRASFAVTALSTMLFSVNLFLAEIDRPELLTRGFSNTYIVRGLGLPAFLAYNANQTYNAHKDRSEATADDLVKVQEYVKANYAAPNPNLFGIAKGRNVIYLHLESFQQFLIDYKLKVNNSEYEVTPFLNSLYHSSETFAFSNFFHQVKAGKTSDAETTMENSLFGLSQGSYMVQYGGSNTAQAAPHILNQEGGYTSAVFHGNSATFWNRNNTYKQWGYNYFFDSSYFRKQTEDNSFQYGLNDKNMFADSIQYLEQMQQPFYTKFITVSNHYPYMSNLKGDELGFPFAETPDETINGYFATANYLDSSVKSFFDYLKAVGIYNNSIIVLYGDHYGISNSRNTELAPLLGKDAETWRDYDNMMLQRVPYMVVVPGMKQGKIIDTYGGDVDNLPTLEHLLGIDSSKYIQVGQDLLSPQHKQVVATRTSGAFVTPKFTNTGGKVYYTETGQEITNPDESTKKEIEAAKAAADAQLAASDAVQTGDLLRFLNNGLPTVDTSTFSYKDSMDALEAIRDKLADKSTSIYSKHGEKTTAELYKSPSYKDLHPDSSTTSSSSTSKK